MAGLLFRPGNVGSPISIFRGQLRFFWEIIQNTTLANDFNDGKVNTIKPWANGFFFRYRTIVVDVHEVVMDYVLPLHVNIIPDQVAHSYIDIHYSKGVDIDHLRLAVICYVAFDIVLIKNSMPVEHEAWFCHL